MAKVETVNLSFPASGSPDVVGYKLYIEEAPKAVTYTSSSWALGSKTSVDLSTLEGMTTKDGKYNLGVTAIDDAGNESSMSLISDVPLDFLAPDPPGQLSITRS